MDSRRPLAFPGTTNTSFVNERRGLENESNNGSGLNTVSVYSLAVKNATRLTEDVSSFSYKDQVLRRLIH